MSSDDPRDVYEAITELVHEHQKEGGDYGTLYLPPEEYESLRAWADYRTAVHDDTIHGLDIVVDAWIDEPAILPDSARDLRPDDWYQADPPEQLIRDLVTPEEKVIDDPLRGTIYRYTDYAFFEVTRRRQALDHELIDKYELDIMGEAIDYDREVEETVRVKFGRQTNELGLELDGLEGIERGFADAIRRHTNTVQKHRVIGTRTRHFRFPYPCLDFTHTEEHYAGWRYVHYGRLFMQNIDTVASKLDFVKAE